MKTHRSNLCQEIFVIDDFEVSFAIFLVGANSGQIPTKCRDLACDAEPHLLKNLAIKLKVKYIFFKLHLQAQIFIFVSCLKV